MLGYDSDCSLGVLVLISKGMRSSENGMSKPQRWISVEEDELTVDHISYRGGDRMRDVGVHLPHTF